MKVLESAARTVYHLKKLQGVYPTWKLKYKTKCKSTENEISRWLRFKEIRKDQPIAFIAREQCSGYGQNSRFWFSPKGGIWLSAAYPIFSKEFSSEIFSLSLAIKLCEMLKNEKIVVNLKWPNDILFESKKLIGFLPRVITRGKETMFVRIGLGMNVLNTTPPEGISLKKILRTRNINKSYWTAKVLKAFNDAVVCNNQKEYVIRAANKYLSKSFLPKGYSTSEWSINSIDNNGNLRIFNCNKEIVLKRFNSI